MNKYELTDITISHYDNSLHRIRALKDFGDVRKGDLGGWIEKENNLSQVGDCWIYDNAKVYGNARIVGAAMVMGEACVYGDAVVRCEAIIENHARVSHNAMVSCKARVADHAWVHDKALVTGNALVTDMAEIYNQAKICDVAHVGGRAVVQGDALITDHAIVRGRVYICGYAIVSDYACVEGIGYAITGIAHISGSAVVRGLKDYIVFKNSWSSGRWFTWTRSNNMWRVGCFYGTGEELIAKAYNDSELSGACYEACVNHANTIKELMEKQS